MDRRILKTKKCLKDALVSLIKEKTFEKITVKEICDRANTGRGTFYTYYDDKYDLLQDCFSDILSELLERYKEMSASKEYDFKESCLAIFDAILDMHESFEIADKLLLSGYEILFMYYQFLMNSIDSFAEYSHVNTKYDRQQLSAFLVLGFWGFTHANPNADLEQLRADAHLLISDLVDSRILQSV